MRLVKYISIFLLIAAGLFFLRSTFAPYRTFTGEIFGTTYSIKIKTSAKDNDLEDKIKAKLQDVNSNMSMFEPQSFISRLNRAAAGEAVELPHEVAFLFRGAAKVYSESRGWFDPTIGSLVNLWGFGTNTVTRIPEDKQIEKALAHTGFNKLRFASDYSQVIKTDSELIIDLSAIAKGYAVDKIAFLLEENGYRDYIVEIGGEVKASGTRDYHGTPWAVGIARPSENGSGNLTAVELENMAVATSGDYRNFFYLDGKRFAHTVSPFDGRPVAHNLASATVFHPQAMLADAYATAVTAMGEDKGMEFANRINLPVIFFVRGDDNQTDIRYSAAAQKLLEE